MESHIKRRCM